MYNQSFGSINLAIRNAVGSFISPLLSLLHTPITSFSFINWASADSYLKIYFLIFNFSSASRTQLPNILAKSAL